MQLSTSVSDEAALQFALGFYDALGAGRSIDDAFEFGRNAIALKGIPEHSVPILKKELTAAEKGRLVTFRRKNEGVTSLV